MISAEQMRRAEIEFTANAAAAVSVARSAEKELEHYTYYGRPYNPVKREQLLKEYQDADYIAESRAWILNLIRESHIDRAIEAQIRSHEDGRRAGLEEAAQWHEEEAKTATSRAQDAAHQFYAAAIRALKTPKGGA